MRVVASLTNARKTSARPSNWVATRRVVCTKSQVIIESFSESSVSVRTFELVSDGKGRTAWHRSDIRLIGDPRLADDLPQVRPRRDRRPPDFTGAASVWRLAANGRCHDIPQEQQRLWQRPWNRSRVVLFRHGDGVPRPPLSGPPMAVAPSTVASGSHCGLTANLRLWSARCSTGFRKRRHDPS